MIGRHPLAVWQFSHGTFSGPWGLRLAWSWAGLEEGAGRGAADREGVLAGLEKASSTQSENWRRVSVKFSCMPIDRLRAGPC